MKNLKMFILGTLVFPITCFASINYKNINDTPMLNRNAPEFNLKDMNGHIVKLSSLKGKVVVVDFWATWCVPCHESFPAMQQVVNHYANDKNVVFLFIDTREKSPDYVRLAKDDMEKHKYNFNVLFDEKGADSIQNKCYLSYGMIGIPTKFFIDKRGIIRYKLEGYSPQLTDEESANDIVNLIEKTKSLSQK